MNIRVLSSDAIRIIASGEVVSRPLSVVKELIENSLDAGANMLNITLHRGGRNLIAVTDNGSGIAKDDLALSLKRYATSKLHNEDINKIKFLGFRGEALSSIATVSKIKIVSSINNHNTWEINSEAGKVFNILPSRYIRGTHIEVRDLFFNIPNKIKFLSSEYLETSACIRLMTRIALGNPKVTFKIKTNNNKILGFYSDIHGSLKARVKEILGQEFLDNVLFFKKQFKNIFVYGYTSIPTYHLKNSEHQYFFVNKRAIRSEALQYAIKVAYNDLLPTGKRARVILFIEIDPETIDVNIHPTKDQIRFKDPKKINSLIIKTIRETISNISLNVSSKVNDKAIKLIAKSTDYCGKKFSQPETSPNSIQNTINFSDSKDLLCNKNEKHFELNLYTMGFAKCQIAKTYILAEKDDDFIIVDQHAAHERINLERMKKEFQNQRIIGQKLLFPIILELDSITISSLLDKVSIFKKLSFIIEQKTINQIIIKQVPAFLLYKDIINIIKNISLHSFCGIDELKHELYKIWGDFACHNSIKGGDILSIQEMNYLLRDMEKHPLTEQCNHGRPVFVRLRINDINKIFER